MEEELKLIVRIANGDLDGNKPVSYALTAISGVSFSFANAVCRITGIEKTKKSGYLTDEEIKKINEVIFDPKKFKMPVWMLNRRRDFETGETKHLLGSDLEFIKGADIRRQKKIKSRRGMRHSRGLPVRGQRTKAHFRTGLALGVQRSKQATAAKTAAK